MKQTTKSLPGIITFAAISALFDLLASVEDRRSVWGRIATEIVYRVWTAAVYFVMPAMVIEGLSFGQAFSRSKELGKKDPTQVGAGVLGVGLMSWVVNVVFLGIAYKGEAIIGAKSPFIGGVFFFFFFNLAWALTGYLKITYFTCFYMWARECEAKKSSATNLAPAPLASALA
jgi:hypothetical protein